MDRKEKFLDQFIFFDLTDRNTGFDVPAIKHFSKEDFDKVLNRIEFFRISIYGIEVHSEGKFLDVEAYEAYRRKPNNSRWYRKAFQKLVKLEGNLVFSATFDVQENLLDLFC